MAEVTKAGSGSATGSGSAAAAKGSGAGAGSNASVDPKVQAAYRAGMKKGRDATAKKAWPDAIAGFDDALMAKPGDARATGERGFARLLEGKELAAAEKDFDRAASSTKDPKILASIWFNRGLLEEKQGNADNALAAFATSNVLRPTAAAAKKLAGKAACALLVDRAVESQPQDVVDWATLAEKLPHEDEDSWDAKAWIADAQKDPLPTLVYLRDGGENHTFAVWQPKGAKGLRVLPVFAASMGRCPGSADYSVAEQASGRMHLHGVEQYEGGYTFMCSGGKNAGPDDLHECTDDPGEESSGTACMGGPSNVRDLIVDDGGKIVMQLEQSVEQNPETFEPILSKIVKIEMTADAVKISGSNCDRTEPIVAPTGTSGATTATGSGAGSGGQGK
ncbi:MAG TPA: hypothetical protein VGM39_12585 [Kofleriaceae bacterium]